MECPTCDSNDSKVIESREEFYPPAYKSVRVRKRLCQKCNEQYITVEVLVQKYNKYKIYHPVADVVSKFLYKQDALF